MKISNNNYDVSIDNKIDAIINNLRKNNKQYKTKLKEYNKLYHELYRELPFNQMQKLDKLLCISNFLSSEELNELFKIETTKKT